MEVVNTGTETSSATFVTCVSSVIQDRERYDLLQAMLQSVRDQTILPDGFCISVYVNPSLGIENRALQKLFKGLTRHCDGTKILRQPSVKTQFQGYKDLAQKIPGWFKQEDIWIMFSDDDDLWGTERVQYYNWAHTMVAPEIADRTRLTFPKTCTHFVCTRCHIRTSSDVDAAIECGCVKFHDVTEAHIINEYTDHAIPFNTFRAFFTRQNDFYIDQNRCCDMQFSEFVYYYPSRGEGKTLSAMPHDANHWIYFYRKADTEKYTSVTSPASKIESYVDIDNYAAFTAEQLEIEFIRYVTIVSWLNVMLYLPQIESLYFHKQLRLKLQERRKMALASYGVSIPLIKYIETNDKPPERIFDDMATLCKSKHLMD